MKTIYLVNTDGRTFEVEQPPLFFMESPVEHFFHKDKHTQSREERKRRNKGVVALYKNVDGGFVAFKQTAHNGIDLRFSKEHLKYVYFPIDLFKIDGFVSFLKEHQADQYCYNYVVTEGDGEVSCVEHIDELRVFSNGKRLFSFSKTVNNVYCVAILLGFEGKYALVHNLNTRNNLDFKTLWTDTSELKTENKDGAELLKSVLKFHNMQIPDADVFKEEPVEIKVNHCYMHFTDKERFNPEIIECTSTSPLEKNHVHIYGEVIGGYIFNDESVLNGKFKQIKVIYYRNKSDVGLGLAALGIGEDGSTEYLHNCSIKYILKNKLNLCSVDHINYALNAAKNAFLKGRGVKEPERYAGACFVENIDTSSFTEINGFQFYGTEKHRINKYGVSPSDSYVLIMEQNGIAFCYDINQQNDQIFLSETKALAEMLNRLSLTTTEPSDLYQGIIKYLIDHERLS